MAEQYITSGLCAQLADCQNGGHDSGACVLEQDTLPY